MQAKKIDTENLIKVGNAVLSKKAIEQLEMFQDDDNRVLNVCYMSILETIGFIASNLYLLPDCDKSKTEDIFQGLANVKDYLTDLKKY